MPQGVQPRLAYLEIFQKLPLERGLLQRGVTPSDAWGARGAKTCTLGLLALACVVLLCCAPFGERTVIERSHPVVTGCPRHAYEHALTTFVGLCYASARGTWRSGLICWAHLAAYGRLRFHVRDILAR